MEYDLVFEGGGAKGIVFVGAMQEFEAHGHTYGRLLGTSAGAITAALLAAGYTTAEMLAALSETQDGQPAFARFLGTPPAFTSEEIKHSAILALLSSIDLPVVPEKVEDWLAGVLTEALLRREGQRHLLSLIERGGWYSADDFVSWMERKLDEGTFQGQPRHFSSMTLAEFHAATGRDLSLVASDTSAGRMLVLNHKTAPGLSLVWAVRMSMSIPLLWPEVEWKLGWGPYLAHGVAGHLVVDGGLLSNFPIELFVSGDPYVIALMGEKTNSSVLGMLIDEGSPVPGAPPVTAESVSAAGISVGQLRIVQRLVRLVDTVTGAHDKMVVDAFVDSVVRLPAGGYGTVEFSMSTERREALLAAGRETMRAYLEAHASRPVSKGVIAMAPLGSIDPMVKQHADHIAARILEWPS